MTDSKSGQGGAPPTPQKFTREEMRKINSERTKAENLGWSQPTPTEEEEIPDEDIDRYLSANELGDGLLFSRLFAGKHLFVGQMRQWCVWGGHHWILDEIDGDGSHYAKADVEAVAKIYEAASNKRFLKAKELEKANPEDGQIQHLRSTAKNLKARAFRLRSESGRANCLKMAKTNDHQPLSIVGDEVDQNPWLLAFKNGVLDLKNGHFRNGQPTDYLLRASPIFWEGIDAPCPTWDQFMLSSMADDPDMVAFLQRVFGYGITGLAMEHIFIVFWGQGRNGKGIMTETIQKVLGVQGSSDTQLAAPIRSQMLLDQGNAGNASAPSPDIMGLKGLRMAFASETNKNKRFSPAQVKWLSGGESLTGRYTYGRTNVTFSPTHLLFLLTNNRPHAPAEDFAFWQRIFLVDFPISFVERPKLPNEKPMDKTLSQKLQEELPGIAAWLVRGCLDWQARGHKLDPPKKVLAATEEYRRDEDFISDFLEECCDVEIGNREFRTQSKELYDVFVWWYNENVSSKIHHSHKSFGNLMKPHFTPEKIGGFANYFGIQIKKETKFKAEK